MLSLDEPRMSWDTIWVSILVDREEAQRNGNEPWPSVQREALCQNASISVKGGFQWPV